MPKAKSTVRLDVQISTDLHAMLERAAEIQGCTMPRFVVAALQDAVQGTFDQVEVTRRALADQERFAQALLARPQPFPALLRAFARRKKLVRTAEMDHFEFQARQIQDVEQGIAEADRGEFASKSEVDSFFEKFGAPGKS